MDVPLLQTFNFFSTAKEPKDTLKLLANHWYSLEYQRPIFIFRQCVAFDDDAGEACPRI